MGQPSIETQQLSRFFRGAAGRTIKALDKVNLTVREGEIFGLLGPNGAGKTTLIKILTTLLLPSEGSAFVYGLDVAKRAGDIRKLINLVSGGETPGYGILTVRENLWFFSQLYGMSSAEVRLRIDELLGDLELEEYRDTRMNKLSTGYKQRLNLARGFINTPKLLFLDEPTLGLDVLSAKKLRKLIREWVRNSRDKTVLLTTHYMAEADELCDRVAIIDRGRILACEAPHRLKESLRALPAVRLDLLAKTHGFDRLKAIKGVVGISETYDIETGVTALRIVLEDESILPNLLTVATADGTKVVTVSKTEPTLEDVYISLVGRGFVEREAERND